MGIQDAVRNNPALAGAIGGATIGALAVAGVGAIRRRRKKTKTVSRRKTTRRKATSTTKRRSTKKRSTSFQRRRSKAFRNASSKKIFMTKKGQPYIKLASGKARFITKKSAGLRKKRKGGFF